MANKYQPPSIPLEPRQAESIGSKPPVSFDKRPILYRDGTLEVEHLIERESSGLSSSLDEKERKYLFSKKLDENTQVEFIPKEVHKVYKTKIKKRFFLKKALATYEGEVKRFITKRLDRYKTLGKSFKKEVDVILKNKNDFLFTQKIYGLHWNQIYIDTVTLGPYNCDTKLVITKDLEFINDLLVIRTGERRQASLGNQFVDIPAGNKIVWVSPHDIFNYSGAGNYLSTGNHITSKISSTGFRSGETFYERHNGITNNQNCYSLSSKHIKIYGDQNIKSDIFYDKQYQNSEIQRNGKPLINSYFYYNYPKYQDHCLTGHWDGVIPSGASFSIESWSTNPRHIGFDGVIEVKPVDESKVENIDLSYEVEAEGSSFNYQESIRLTISKAKKKFYNKVNKYLIKSGLKYKNKNFKRFEKLLEKVAQNVYDGLSIVRNENIAKLQSDTSLGLIDSPIYYDGTSKLYGGSQEKSFYDNLYTAKSKLINGGDHSDSVNITNMSNENQTNSSPGGFY